MTSVRGKYSGMRNIWMDGWIYRWMNEGMKQKGSVYYF